MRIPSKYLNVRHVWKNVTIQHVQWATERVGGKCTRSGYMNCVTTKWQSVGNMTWRGRGDTRGSILCVLISSDTIFFACPQQETMNWSYLVPKFLSGRKFSPKDGPTTGQKRSPSWQNLGRLQGEVNQRNMNNFQVQHSNVILKGYPSFKSFHFTIVTTLQWCNKTEC